MSDTRVIERVGTNTGLRTETHMGMKPSRKTFKIFSTILYKDRIKAIIRELSCNAYDSHFVAGCADKPFEIHIPTRFDPYFSVRDFGTGLTPEQIETIYSTYGESTKEDDPDQIGSLGLGSKSPLCYANSFTTTSYYNGMKYQYAIFFDEEDLPTIKMLSEETTEEPNGLEVSVPLASQADCNTFVEKCKVVFQHFHVKPKFFGAEIEFPPKEVVLAGNNWRFIKLSSYGYHPNCATIIMAQVSYPLDMNSIPNLTAQERSILSRPGIEIDCPNGSLTFMGGRDDLSYDKRTCRALKEIATAVYEDFQGAIDRQLDACENDFEARLKSIQIDSTIANRLNFVHRYKGQVIEPFYNLRKLGLTDTFVLKVWSRNGRRRRIDTEYTVAVAPKICYVIDDSKLGIAQTKLHDFMREHYNSVDILYVFNGRTPEENKAIREALPSVPFKTPAEAFLHVKKRIYTPRQVTKSIVLDSYTVRYGNRYDWNRSCWNSKTETRPATSGVYVLKHGVSIVSPWCKNVYQDINFLKQAYELELIADTPIYGVSVLEKEKLVGDWIEIYDHIIKNAKDKIKNSKEPLTNKSKQALERLRSNYNEFYYADAYIDHVRKYANVLDLNHPMRVFIQEYDAVNKITAFNEFCFRLGLIKIVDEDKMSKMWKEIMTKYPLFPTDRDRNFDASHMKQYIDMCDGKMTIVAKKR